MGPKEKIEVISGVIRESFYAVIILRIFYFPTVSQKSMKLLSDFGTYLILLFLVVETKLLISRHCKCSMAFEQRNILLLYFV